MWCFPLNSSFRFQFQWIWITCKVVIERIFIRRELHGYLSASDRCYGRVFDMNGSHASKISGFSDQLEKWMWPNSDKKKCCRILTSEMDFLSRDSCNAINTRKSLLSMAFRLKKKLYEREKWAVGQMSIKANCAVPSSKKANSSFAELHAANECYVKYN